MSSTVLAASAFGGAASLGAVQLAPFVRRRIHGRPTNPVDRIKAIRTERARSSAIEDQLAPALQLIVGNLRVGRNVVASFSEVAEAVPEPLGGLLREVVAEAKLGTPAGEVLMTVAERESNRHLAIVASALVLHGRHGGSLVEILETVIETVEEEDRLRRDLRSVTADGRLSAVVLLAMPPVVLVFVSAMSPGYAAPLVTTPLGIAMSGTAAVLGAVGWRWLHRLGNPEIAL